MSWMHTDMPVPYHDSATNASVRLGADICQAICPLPNILICKGKICDVRVPSNMPGNMPLVRCHNVPEYMWYDGGSNMPAGYMPSVVSLSAGCIVLQAIWALVLWAPLAEHAQLPNAMIIHAFISISCEKTFFVTRPKPAYGRQGLDWIVGPGYSFVVFSTNKTIETNQKP